MAEQTLERLFSHFDLSRITVKEYMKNDDGYTKSPDGFQCTLVFPFSVFITGFGDDTLEAISVAVNEAYARIPTFHQIRNIRIFAHPEQTGDSNG